MDTHVERSRGTGLAARRVTHHQLSWKEGAHGEPGAFLLELSLDYGAAEYLLRPSSAEAQVLIALLSQTVGTVFDLDRRTLIFGSPS